MPLFCTLGPFCGGVPVLHVVTATADTPSFINEEDFLALSTAVQGSLDAMVRASGLCGR